MKKYYLTVDLMVSAFRCASISLFQFVTQPTIDFFWIFSKFALHKLLSSACLHPATKHQRGILWRTTIHPTLVGTHTKEKLRLLLIHTWAPLIAYLKRQEMAPLIREEKRNTKVRSISQSYTALCVDSFVWVYKRTHQKNVYSVLGVFNTGPKL